MNYTAPNFKSDSFHCPNCNVYAHIIWHQLIANQQVLYFYQAKCTHCNKTSIWKVTDFKNDSRGRPEHFKGEMIFPKPIPVPNPNVDMDVKIQGIYQEAALILSDSPKGATALLRLALQMLLKQVGKSGKKINNDIKELVSEGLSPKIQKALDILRVVGNNAVHPGQIDIDDNNDIALKLFSILNFIADELITKPRELESLFDEIIPEETKEHIVQRDS